MIPHPYTSDEELTWITSISSVPAKTPTTAPVTPFIKSTSTGPPRDLIREFASWTASPGT